MSTITVTFDPPTPADSPSAFNTKAFATLGDLNTWSTQANTVAGEVNTNASTATSAASTASSAASSATTSASTATTQASNASSSASAAAISESNAAATASASSASAQAASASAASAGVYASQAQATNPDSPIRLNPRKITADFTVASTYNAASVGPITISEGITVTVSDNATWSIH